LSLDDVPEFHHRSLEVLRQHVEGSKVTTAPALTSTMFPADLILVAAMNPCPCCYLGDGHRPCKCNPVAIERYRGKIRGPLWDRIDLHIEASAVAFHELAASADGTSRAVLRAQVQKAHQAQQQRFGGRQPPVELPHDQPAVGQVRCPGRGGAEAREDCDG
jgi:magnesium chelatase family protein